RVLEELGAAHLRHALVRHDDGDVVRGEQLEPARAALGGENAEILAVVVAKGSQDVGFVVDDEHLEIVVVQCHGAAPYLPAFATLSSERACRVGTRIRTVVPAPGEVSSSIAPPCAVTTWWLIARPRPVPPPTSLVVKNGSKTRSTTSGGIPGPSSR